MNRCTRCGGSMIYERFLTRHEPNQFYGWRCIMCSEVVDPVVIRNRMMSAKVKPVTPKIDRRYGKKPGKKQVWHRGAGLHDVGRPLSLSRAEKQYGRENYISALPAPRNRIGEGR